MCHQCDILLIFKMIASGRRLLVAHTKSRASLIGLLFLSAVPGLGTAETLSVPVDYPTIKDAMTAAVHGDTVLVACGTYYERAIVMKSGVTLRSETGDPNCVTIDGQYLGRIFLCDGVDEATRFEGLTVTHGRVAGAGEFFWGAGMLCRNDANPSISSCVFRENRADHPGQGGAMAWIESSPVVTDCRFERNEALWDEESPTVRGTGGAVHCLDSTGSILRCTFTENVAGGHAGGAVYCEFADLDITDCVFTRNTARQDGGAIACWNSSPVITRCEFLANTAYRSGGALNCDPTANADVRECRFVGNTGNNGGAVYIRRFSCPSFSDCEFVDNVAQDGGAVAVRFVETCGPTFTRCLFSGNEATNFGGGAVWCDTTPPTLFANCTFAYNTGDRGSCLYLSWASARFESCIIAFHGPGEFIRCTGGEPEILCSDVFGNAAGDWQHWCVAPWADRAGNFSADPLFCDPEGGDFHLDGNSPCLDGHSPGAFGCELVGALDRGCGPTAAKPTTWSLLKSVFRE